MKQKNGWASWNIRQWYSPNQSKKEEGGGEQGGRWGGWGWRGGQGRERKKFKQRSLIGPIGHQMK